LCEGSCKNPIRKTCYSTSRKKKVILITFNNEVSIIGDGSHEPIIVAGDHLFDFDKLFEIGSKFTIDKVQPLNSSSRFLFEKIAKLEEEGSTALGPALFIGVGIASQQPCSEVILCTDGLPNVGIGDLDNPDPAFQKEQREIYSSISNLAKSKNISISIVGIQGSDCALDCLSKCAESTSGTVNILHPLELVRQLRQISQVPVVASKLQFCLILHPELGLDRLDSPQNLSRAVTEIANATSESDLTFQYSLRERCKSNPPKIFPFQAQIHYTKPDGTRLLRILTSIKKCTNDREICEKSCNAGIIGLNGIHKAARLAQKGDFVAGRLKLKAIEKLMERGCVTDLQQEELGNYLTLSDELDVELRQCLKNSNTTTTTSTSSSIKSLVGKKSNENTSIGDDNTTKVLFKMKSANKYQIFGSEKKDIVSKRKGNAEMNKQYYSIKF